jgi:transcriptional regulator with XRE-family HTH domain
MNEAKPRKPSGTSQVPLALKRREHKLSQTALANLLGVTRYAISNAEHGIWFGIGIQKYDQLAKMWDCTLEDLLPDEVMSRVFIMKRSEG